MFFKRQAMFLIIFFGLIMALMAQDFESEDYFPDHLRVGIRDDSVYLTWKDSGLLDNGYLLYRHTEEPSLANMGRAAFIAEVPSGVGHYEYLPPDSNAYYYFVLGKKSDNTAYEYFIPLRNVSLGSIAFTGKTSVMTRRGLINSIIASSEMDSVLIRFTARDVTGRVIIYRSLEAIKKPDDILRASIAALVEPGTGMFRDYPVPGISYFYAAIPEQDIISANVTITPNENATVRGIELAKTASRIGLPDYAYAGRAIPLPSLLIARTLTEAKPLVSENLGPESLEISDAAEQALLDTVRRFGRPLLPKTPSANIFPEDLDPIASSQDYSLGRIINLYFAKGLYKESANELSLYLSLPRKHESIIKAHFYRGQSLALSGQLKEAFFDFLQVKDYYYQEASEWMDYILLSNP